MDPELSCERSFVLKARLSHIWVRVNLGTMMMMNRIGTVLEGTAIRSYDSVDINTQLERRRVEMIMDPQ